MLMVPTTPLLEQVLAAQTNYVWLEQALLVTPDYMNQKGRWLMEPLLEVSSIRDERGNDLGYQYRVEGDRTYSTSEAPSLDGWPNKHLVFSAALHLRS